MIDAAASPLRVGLIGGGRVGLHLIEQFSAGGPFQVVAADQDFGVADAIASLGVRPMSLRQMAESEDVDVLWLTSLERETAEAVCSMIRGRSVIAEAPLSLSQHDFERFLAALAEREGRLLTHHPRRSDADFRQALTVARDPVLGAIRAAKFVSWGYGRVPRGAARRGQRSGHDELASPGATKLRLAVHALDQLVLLIPSRPLRVSAAVGSDARSPDLVQSDSLSVRIVFESGCQAEIEIRLDSPTLFQSGWVLTAERGGFANGRQFTLTDDGEVFDAPVQPAGSDGVTDPVVWLAQQIRSGVRDAAEEARAFAVAAILDGAQRSLITGQPVTLA